LQIENFFEQADLFLPDRKLPGRFLLFQKIELYFACADLEFGLQVYLMIVRRSEPVAGGRPVLRAS
jgi:hypothetical protein